ncbi:hypothetical protein UCRPA7_3754 [Phaeoacremonium minimum UCRPA7]|uniref:Uncharacterized protein n=1 Tax=Phaeoacremonium minimum (strain UCR-PA7) TaxID=1286976 RepID=R8BN65_PHAM7|nr:hypothetical protein UCRPA7_3754 [Phaeoacremonium minimum UCRPA7]EOO00735.1 hypothetical protein UCRPA7_3754 [Phaeoacremonium minimum UCRPA7]
MHASTSFLTAMALLSGLAAAFPGGAGRVRREAASPTDLWVTVGPDGTPKTVTPVLTTISGTPTVISGAPNDLTATVFTRTSQGDVRTSTGDAPIPTATDKAGAGSFSVCHNKDGVNAPFCQPSANSTLNPGKTYYITWDPTFFSAANTSILVQGDYINSTTGEIETQAFASSKLSAAWAFYALAVDTRLMQGKKSVNISLTIAALAPGASTMTAYTGPTIRIAEPQAYQQEKTKAPTGPALYIGLPTVLGFVVVCLIGTCIWNRKTRKIALGNIMGKGRDGYGVGKSRARRMAGGGRSRREKKEAIQLMSREVPAEQQYHDDFQATRGSEHDWDAHSRNEFEGLPRRDSDALGSLAGTPTEDRHMEFQRPGRGNAFRDELSRQERERS